LANELQAKFRRAVEAFQARDLAKAEKILQQIRKSAPDIFDVEHLLGVIKLVQGRFADAEIYLRAAVGLNGNSDEALSNYGYALKSLNRPQEALAFFTRALAVNPRNPLSYHNRGSILAEAARNYPEAIDQFDKAILYNPNFADAYASKGNCLEKLRRFEDALVNYDKALSIRPDLEIAVLGRGNSLRNLGRHDEAFATYDRALSIRPDFADAWIGRGDVLTDLKRYDDAFVAYEKALAIKPDRDTGWVARGNLGWICKRYDEASEAYDRALSINPGLETAWLGRGNVCCDLRRYDAAFDAYDKALSIRPDLAEAWLGKGNVHWKLKRHQEALEAFDRALSIKPDLETAWLGRANACFDLKRHDEALANFERALSIKPDLAEARLGGGNVFAEMKRLDEALAAYEQALSIRPDLVEAWVGRGNVLWSLKRYEQALASYDRTLSLNPDFEGAWLGRGNVFSDLRRYDDAFAAYDKAWSIEPDLEGLEGARLHAKMNLCDWTNLEEEAVHLNQAIGAGKPNSSPFTLLSVTDSPDEQLRCARVWVAARHPLLARAAGSPGPTYDHGKIRLGYVSPDLREHPVGYLTAEMFENHDPNRFETYAFSIGPDDDSSTRRRLQGAFDRFVDCHGKSDGEVLQEIKQAQIDILVDLAGHTQNARPSLFAARPARVAVNFLGFAGTLGSKGLSDYIIADHVVLPDSNSHYFEEKVVRLPGSFMPRDTKGQAIDGIVVDRADHDLRPDWIVFCCFNNAYKINPPLFASWMNILKKVDHSVLWLSGMGDTAKSNLRREAKKAGVDPDRLVFAKHVSSLAEHIARHRLADLFLDTLPYNAHTTASDALWAGLPIVTQIGESFAGRVAASLLSAVGLPELIARTRHDYEALAIDLALDRQKLQVIRQKLQENRSRSLLFDMARYVKRLEAAYEAMHRRHQAGLPPEHIEIQA
jgi:protein O-GlcNAc transferase